MYWPARAHPLWNGWPIRRGRVRDWVCVRKGTRGEQAGIGLQGHIAYGTDRPSDKGMLDGVGLRGRIRYGTDSLSGGAVGCAIGYAPGKG